MTPKRKKLQVPPQAVVCAKMVLKGFGHDVATEHVGAALMELLIWQRDNPEEKRWGHAT